MLQPGEAAGLPAAIFAAGAVTTATAAPWAWATPAYAPSRSTQPREACTERIPRPATVIADREIGVNTEE